MKRSTSSNKPLSPSLKSSSKQASESESDRPISSSKKGQMSSPDEEDEYDEEDDDMGDGSSSEEEPIDQNLLNKLDNIKKNLREGGNTSQSHQFES
jgi:hypothetical protein